MKTAEIHKRWLDFFAARGHEIVRSASLVSDDPSLMFTVAGMVPFVPYLTGIVPAPYKRATSVQKCIRTNDIEEVGRTPRHGTFFQMCGNFSFGDYFKEEAIRYAWEFLTTPEQAGGLGFKAEDLWATVYEEDDEAHTLWLKHSSLPENRVQRLGKDTNYWSTGQPGPAGPCSEIFYDMGPAYGPDGGPATDSDRYVEIWNLVFMQYQITDVQSKLDFTIVGELPNKNIDTGMGLERVAFIKQGVENMYEIDQVRPVLDTAALLCQKKYGDDLQDDVRFRIIADHVRSGLMLIQDGVTPANEGRGYILRRILRRIILSMRLLGYQKPCFAELFAASRDAMGQAYPEVFKNYGYISAIAFAEEKAFMRTLDAGMHILDKAVTQNSQVKTGDTQNLDGTATKNQSETRDTAKQQNSENNSSSTSATLSGQTAFLLHDTHGFPIELTLEIAEAAGLTVDATEFKRLMHEQRDRAKTDAKTKRGQRADLNLYKNFRAAGETLFTGYTQLEHESEILGIIVDGESVQNAVEGQTAEIILAETSMWAEAGGQDADQGLLVGAGFEAEILDVQKPVPGLIVHTALLRVGNIGVGERAISRVDPNYRQAAAQAHSATHILHAALRQILGPTAHQSGSYNKAGYLRLDFTHGQPLSQSTKTEIEEICALAITANHEVITREMPLDEAKKLGAMALFGEKYGDRVRVVDIGGPWSRELCAGTHVSRSGEIGLINLISESSVGQANRRIESLVGKDALKSFAVERAIVQKLASELKVPRESLENRVQALADELRRAQKRITQLESEQLQGKIPELVQAAESINNLTVVVANIGEIGQADELRSLALQTREKLAAKAAVVTLFGVLAGKPLVVAATNEAARGYGVKAGALVREAAKTLGGGGGGKDDIAQGGGQDTQQLCAAQTAVLQSIK